MRLFTFVLLILLTSFSFVNGQNLSASHCVGTWDLTLKVNIDVATNTATVIMTGPEDTWFAYGFGGSIMSGTYAIIAEANAGNTLISERTMGHHNEGVQLVDKITNVDVAVNSPMRTVTLTLPASGMDANFDFPSEVATISFISAMGFQGLGSIGFHGGDNYIQGPAGLAFSTVVPVTWSYFELGEMNENAILSWETEIEINNSGFYVQRSLDARNWTDLRFVEGKSESGASYEFIDKKNLPGINYYRLKQVDLDGTESFSVIKSIEIRGSKAHGGIVIFPNPVKDMLTLEMESSDETKRVQIIDMNYKSLADEIWTSDSNKYSLNVSDYPAGHYMISVKHKDWSYTSHFVKQ